MSDREEHGRKDRAQSGDEVEPQLAQRWSTEQRTALEWNRARLAVRDAWDRATRKLSP